MRNVREVLRLRFANGLPQRAVAGSLGLSQSTVSDYLGRARRARLSWPLPEELDDERLEALLFPPAPDVPIERRPKPDWGWVHRELRRANVTLALLWEEYRGGAPDGFGYSWFCDLYKEWAGRLKPTMRQVHIAGERLFVDFAGHTMEVCDGLTGEIRTAQIFVAVLGASSFTYAEATSSQTLPDWVGAHVRAYEFFGGAARQTVSDNLKSGITKACFYEPMVNRTHTEMAAHYGSAIIPARPYKARDKAKAEVGVQVVQRWILARLRHRRFFSLAALDAAIRALLDDLNDRPMRSWGISRRALYEQLDKPALLPLPAERYEYAEWKRCRVGLDYHVEIAKHWYSVPYPLLRHEVYARITLATVEIFPPRQARRQPSAQQSAASSHHGRRAHAERAPAIPRLDARAHPARGGQHRRGHGRAGRGDPALAPASRAGLPILCRHPAPGQALRHRAGRRGLRPRAHLRHPLLHLGRDHPQKQPGQHRAGP
jgi:transposase